MSRYTTDFKVYNAELRQRNFQQGGRSNGVHGQRPLRIKGEQHPVTGLGGGASLNLRNICYPSCLKGLYNIVQMREKCCEGSDVNVKLMIIFFKVFARVLKSRNWRKSANRQMTLIPDNK